MTARRAAPLVAALLAMTINFLQPLAHAALMRDGGPTASGVWASMCQTVGQDGASGTPQAQQSHDCCLGLAHAPPLPLPPASFAVVEPFVVAVARPEVALDDLMPVGIRDGPTQPHAPPLTV